jgi:hypothetical protein
MSEPLVVRRVPFRKLLCCQSRSTGLQGIYELPAWNSFSLLASSTPKSSHPNILHPPKMPDNGNNISVSHTAEGEAVRTDRSLRPDKHADISRPPIMAQSYLTRNVFQSTKTNTTASVSFKMTGVLLGFAFTFRMASEQNTIRVGAQSLTAKISMQSWPQMSSTCFVAETWPP